MAFDNLFIRKKSTIGNGNVTIELDAVLNENHSSKVRVTSNPVELGADITDHKITEPKELNILGVVSDTPIGIINATGQIIDNTTSLFGSSSSSNVTRSTQAYLAIEQLQQANELIEIQTNIKLYTNMIITNLSLVQDKDSSRIVLMNISLKEIIIVESETIEIGANQLEEGTTTIQSSSTSQRGRQEPIVPTPSVETSYLESIVSWGG